MTAPFDVLCFASKEWGSHRQRPHWVAEGLVEAGARVLFVENIGTRLPHVREVGRVGAKLFQWARTSGPDRPARPNLLVDAPLVPPMQHLRVIRAASSRLLARRLGRRLPGDRPLVTWTYLPMPVIRDVSRRLGADLLVYEWADDAAAHVLTKNARQRRRLAAWEDEMAADADITFFSSAELMRRRGAATGRSVLAPHGAPFLRPRSGPAPAGIDELPSPRVGFVGSITEFTDLELLASLARARPAWSFVVVGPARVNVRIISALPNVTLTGQLPHDDVLAMLPALDAAVIPYRVGPAIEVASPVKVHEYLAAGLPVVSVDIPEVRDLAPDVTVATGADEFLTALDAAVARGRGRASERHTWGDCVEEMVTLVTAALGDPAALR